MKKVDFMAKFDGLEAGRKTLDMPENIDEAIKLEGSKKAVFSYYLKERDKAFHMAIVAGILKDLVAGFSLDVARTRAMQEGSKEAVFARYLKAKEKELRAAKYPTRVNSYDKAIVAGIRKDLAVQVFGYIPDAARVARKLTFIKSNCHELKEASTGGMAMTNIARIQEQLKSFEKKKDNKEGIEHLRTALEEMEMLSEATEDKEELWFVHNQSLRYCNMVIEMGRKVARNGQPSFDELDLIIDYMSLFKEQENPNFKDILGKTWVLYLEAFKREFEGEKLDDSLKTEIYNSLTKKR